MKGRHVINYCLQRLVLPSAAIISPLQNKDLPRRPLSLSVHQKIARRQGQIPMGTVWPPLESGPGNVQFSNGAPGKGNIDRLASVSVTLWPLQESLISARQV